LDDLEARLKAKEIDCQRIAINIAAHSRMLEPILQDFGDYLRAITLNAPQIPFTSNRSGTLAGQHDKLSANQIISSLRHPKDDVADDAYFMAMLGRLWAVGSTFDWDQIWGEARRVRVPLPTYAFQHAPYFIEPGKAVSDEETQWLTRSEMPEDWGYRPAWLPRYAACDVDVTGDLSEAEVQTWLIFADDAGLCEAAAARLRDAGHPVVMVRADLGSQHPRPDPDPHSALLDDHP